MNFIGDELKSEICYSIWLDKVSTATYITKLSVPSQQTIWILETLKQTNLKLALSAHCVLQYGFRIDLCFGLNCPNLVLLQSSFYRLFIKKRHTMAKASFLTNNYIFLFSSPVSVSIN